ncbi:MAG: GAF domain-containing protein [Gammaproteobacteria bacterium]|jgi:GAF domain-containing protein
MSLDRRDIAQMLRDENERLRNRSRLLSDQIVRQQQAFRALNEMDQIMREMRDGFDISGLIHDLLALALHACDSENGSLILIDDASGDFVFADVIGQSRDSLLNYRISPDTGIVGEVVRTQQAKLVKDVRSSDQWSSSIDRAIGFKTNALMCAPLFANRKVYGAIEVVNNLSGIVFDDNDLAILRVTARFVSQALQEAEDITLLENEYQ